MVPYFILYSTFPYCIISEIYRKKREENVVIVSNYFMYSLTFCHNFFQLYIVCIVKYIVAVKIVLELPSPALYYLIYKEAFEDIFLMFQERKICKCKKAQMVI